jgi:hypothetical protein
MRNEKSMTRCGVQCGFAPAAAEFKVNGGDDIVTLKIKEIT